MENSQAENNVTIKGASYIGEPKSYTVMYISKKVEHLLKNLEGIEGSLIFAEEGIDVPDAYAEKNRFVYTENPQREYAEYMQIYADRKWNADKGRHYTLTNEGYYLGENAKIGDNACIEPGCLIGHDVIIGKNAHIRAGVKIKNAVIGDDFIANENAVIGADGFTMAIDLKGNKFRIPTLGKVIIGNGVEIGALNNVSVGSGRDTVIEDYVKLDALVHVGHDVRIKKNTEVTAGVIISGFAVIGEDVFIGVNASVRNRVELADSCFIGMGANVTKSVNGQEIVAGNPAHPIRKK